jgi:hypothetical protein
MRQLRPSLVLLAFVAAGVRAQGAQQSLEFEVASVKPAAPQTGGGTFVGVRGGPGTGRDWIDTQRYDIAAKVAESSTMIGAMHNGDKRTYRGKADARSPG